MPAEETSGGHVQAEMRAVLSRRATGSLQAQGNGQEVRLPRPKLSRSLVDPPETHPGQPRASSTSSVNQNVNQKEKKKKKKKRKVTENQQVPKEPEIRIEIFDNVPSSLGPFCDLPDPRPASARSRTFRFPVYSCPSA